VGKLRTIRDKSAMRGKALRSLMIFMAVVVSLGAAVGGAADPPLAAKRTIDFVTDVRPIFAKHCFTCHGPAKQKSSFRLDVKASALTGGDLGKDIVPGKGTESPLIQYVSGAAEPTMPPGDKHLSPLEIAILRAWIDQGAVWPASADGNQQNPANWWSLKSLERPTVPGSAHPIDAFIRAKQREKNLASSPIADRRTLIRRLYFDLIGLPPSPEEIDAFAADEAPTAYDRLIDKLLASPQYGERWARHWLDVVHYGDTHGYDKDKPRPNAWPYRDYVIRSLNDDKPYGRFVREQIAGDVLFPNQAEGIEALGFLSAGPWDFIGHAELPESKIDGQIARHLDRDDIVTNTIQTFMSLTVQCAQCHNHKFDPITQDDYYSLQAVYASLDRTDRAYDHDPTVAARRSDLLTRKAASQAAKTEIEAKVGAQLDDWNQRIAIAGKAEKQEPQSIASARDRAAQLTRERDDWIRNVLTPDDRARYAAVIADLASLDKDMAALPKPSMVYCGAVHTGSGSFLGTGPGGGKPRPIFILPRGDVTKPGREVQPGALAVLAHRPARFELPPTSTEGDRRAALAEWIADPKNPLTWRSIVNRVWRYHFGRGLVETPSDFGRMGQLPTHPELLDWLAIEFRDGGQSLKKLHRLIVTSETYRQSSNGDAFTKVDADNAYYWRMNRRKLDSESVRDSILAVSGKLDLRMYGPAFQDFVIDKPEHSPHYEYERHDPNDPQSHRRSIYRFLVRSRLQPFMTVMDCADPSMQVDKRNESVSAGQALALLNDGFVLAMSTHFAARIEKLAPDSPGRVKAAVRLAIGRLPTATELSALTAFTDRHGLANCCRLLFNLNEFVFVD
jgi:mono/diheme cytochrome c family protein